MPFWLLLSLAILGLDQLAKLIVKSNMVLGQDIPIIPGFFSLTYVHNPGAAFGILANQTALLVTISTLLLIGVFVYRERVRQAPLIFKIGLFMALGGALGNLVDRLRLRYVVDFFYLRHYTVFNIADIAIVCGVALLFWNVLMTERRTNN